MDASRFIAIEGIDGAGTTTQAHMLAFWLRFRGEKVVCTAEPSDSWAGWQIKELQAKGGKVDEIVLALLFAADRREHLKSTILPALDRGEWVVTDRYLLSSIAYQSTGAPFEWVCELNRLFPRPALTLLLDVAVQVALRRVDERGGGREHYEKQATLQRVRDNFLRAVEAGPELAGRVEIVDATGDEDEVHGRIEKIVIEMLEKPDK